MKNLEIVKVKVENLRELFKFLLLVELSLITGIVTLTYAILVGKSPLFLFVFVTAGFIISIFLVIVLKYIWEEMNKLRKGLE